MSGFMLHGLGDCTPERHCGCLDIPAMTAPEPTRPADEHTGTVALDLDAIEAAALADDGWWSVPVLALVAEVRSLRAKVAAVEALHQPIDAMNYQGRTSRLTRVCTGCGTDDGNWQHWPCPTVRALATTGEGE